jgi:hypothetical protein
VKSRNFHFVLRQILPEENRPKIHTNASIPAQAGGDNPVFAGEISLLITTLVVGVIIGIFIGDIKTINCDTSSYYCTPLESTNLRRSF